LWGAAHGIDVSSIRMAAGFDLAAAMIEAVAVNMGVAVVPRCLIEREVAQKRLAIPIDLTASTDRGYYLCVHRARETEPMLELFRKWLLQQASGA